jgi:hypothetical protein
LNASYNVISAIPLTNDINFGCKQCRIFKT